MTASTPTPNLSLLKAAIDWAEEHNQAPDEAAPGTFFWNQENWYVEANEEFSCGTGVCLAGHISISHGGKPVLGKEHGMPEHITHWVALPDGTSTSIRTHAQRLLGISNTEASILFYQDNTIPMLREMYDVLERGGDLEQWWYYEQDVPAVDPEHGATPE